MTSKKLSVRIVGAAWLALGAAFVAALVSARWQGCNELPTTTSEDVAVLGFVIGVAALVLGAFAVLWGNWSNYRRRELLVILGTAVISISAAAGVYLMIKHHPVSAGCG